MGSSKPIFDQFTRPCEFTAEWHLGNLRVCASPLAAMPYTFIGLSVSSSSVTVVIIIPRLRLCVNVVVVEVLLLRVVV